MATNEDYIMSWIFCFKCEPNEAIKSLLVDSEEILQSYSTIRDKATLTNKRLIIYNAQGIIGKKKEFYLLPNKSIDMWSSEDSGTFDLDTKLNLWTKAGYFKLKQSLKCDIREFDSILGEGILNSYYAENKGMCK